MCCNSRYVMITVYKLHLDRVLHGSNRTSTMDQKIFQPYIDKVQTSRNAGGKYNSFFSYVCSMPLAQFTQRLKDLPPLLTIKLESVLNFVESLHPSSLVCVLYLEYLSLK